MPMIDLPKHFIRVGAANEISYVEHALSQCGGLILSQPLVFKTNVGTYLESYNKPFLIDPETYRYFFERRRHYKQKKIRAWLKDMSEVMPSEIQSSFGKRRALPENFDAVQIIDFCKANMNIQLSIKGQSGESIKPAALMSPYFMLDNKDYTKNMMFHAQLIKTMVRVNESGLPVIGVLYLSRELLARPERLKALASTINGLTCDGVAVWIENFDESTADEDELINLREFYSNMASEKYILSLYGGLAQIMMIYNGVSAVCNGIHYQTHRSGLAEGGGPAHYFYMPNLRERIRTIDASAMIGRQQFNRAAYLNSVCDCSVCNKIISHNPSAAILSLEGNKGSQVSSLVIHFNHNKHIEILKTNDLSPMGYAKWIIKMMNELNLTSDEEEYRETLLMWISAALDVDIEDIA